MTQQTQPQTAPLTVRDRLKQNHQALIEAGQFRAERDKVVQASEAAPMLKKAGYITQAVAYSLEVEKRMLLCVQNLSALAAEALLTDAQPSQTDPETDPETGQTDAETVPATDAESVSDGETVH